MRGSLERLDEYERFYFPGGRCQGCEFPLHPNPHKDKKRIQCPGFKEDKCNYFLKCERPSCPGIPKQRCVSCGFESYYDCCGGFRCHKCGINYVCHDCHAKYHCEICPDGSDYYCAPCQGPLRLHVIAYAGNVKPTLRQMLCQRCFDYPEDEANLVRTCVKCAIENYMFCPIPDCRIPFCPHKNPGQTLCDKHMMTDPSPIAKKAKSDKDQ